MGRIFKKVVNGDEAAEVFTAVPVSIVVPVFVTLFSATGAMATWTLATIAERNALVRNVRADFAQDIAAHTANEMQRFGDIERRIESLEARVSDLDDRARTVERQVNINTGILERRK